MIGTSELELCLFHMSTGNDLKLEDSEIIEACSTRTPWLDIKSRIWLQA